MSSHLSLPPLKKRRFVFIEDNSDEDSSSSRSSSSSSSSINSVVLKTAQTHTSTNATSRIENSNASIPSRKPQTVAKKTVSWNDLKENTVHSLEHDFNRNLNHEDIWYTREDYDEFLLDRIRTIEFFRGMTNNENESLTLTDCGTDTSKKENNGNINKSSRNKITDSLIGDVVGDCYCMRGLEPFQDDDTNVDYHSLKKICLLTIIMEQTRQGSMGIKQPERFRFLVASHSDLAIHRARKLAEQDEKDVYPFRLSSSSIPVSLDFFYEQYRRSSMSILSELQKSSQLCRHDNNGGMYPSVDIPISTSSISTNNPYTAPFRSRRVSSFDKSSLFTESIRRMQEKNARRLMEIYKRDTPWQNYYHPLFRFSMQRRQHQQQSLQRHLHLRMYDGGIVINKHRRAHHKRLIEQSMLAIRTNRFPIRRDTWSHLQESCVNNGTGL